MHLNTLLSGHLVNLMRGGGGGEVERRGAENEGKLREREREGESKGSNCNTKREGEELKGERGVKEGVCGEHWLI